MTENIRICPSCGRIKSVSEMNSSSNYCRECDKARKRKLYHAYSKNNPISIIARDIKTEKDANYTHDEVAKEVIALIDGMFSEWQQIISEHQDADIMRIVHDGAKHIEEKLKEMERI